MQIKKPTQDEIIRAEDQGLHAFFSASASMNPYPIGSYLAAKWLEGYSIAAQNQTAAVARIKKRRHQS